MVSIYWQGDDPFPLKSWLQVTYPLLKAASFDTFCHVASQPQEREKEVQQHLTRTRHRLANEPSTKVLRRPELPQNGDKLPKFVVFLDNFDNTERKGCCRVSLYKNCQRQSYNAINCLSSGINMLAGGSSVPLTSERKGTDPPLEAPALHTLRLIARQP